VVVGAAGEPARTPYAVGNDDAAEPRTGTGATVVWPAVDAATAVDAEVVPTTTAEEEEEEEDEDEDDDEEEPAAATSATADASSVDGDAPSIERARPPTAARVRGV
jgi:hypothetical protein